MARTTGRSDRLIAASAVDSHAGEVLEGTGISGHNGSTPHPCRRRDDQIVRAPGCPLLTHSHQQLSVGLGYVEVIGQYGHVGD